MATKNFKNIVLPPKYVPKKTEPYMCPEHLAYFYQLLTARREELAHDHNGILNDVRIADKTENAGVGDEQDQSTFEQEIAMDLRMSERSANLLKKIDAALERIENGTFGYSVISGDEIGLQRLMARPLATKTIEEQEEIEKNEK